MSLWPHQSAVTDFFPRESLGAAGAVTGTDVLLRRALRPLASPQARSEGGYHRPSGFILRACSAFMAAEIPLLLGPFWGVVSSGSGHFEGEGCLDTTEGSRESSGLEA